MSFQEEARGFKAPEEMARAYLAMYFGNQRIEYPINPFQMLKDEGILFSLMNLMPFIMRKRRCKSSVV